MEKQMNKDTLARIRKFRDDRDWRQFHNPKDLAISISLEANELLELFQWSGQDTYCEAKKADMEEELSDVLVYCVHMADALGIDLDDIINRKMDKNEAKYPVEKAKGTAKKYSDL